MIEVKNFRNILEVLDYFKEESTCKKYIEQQRWHNGVYCPHCLHYKVYNTKRGYRCANANCKRDFTVTTRTVMENTKIKLRYWLAATYILTAHKKGISSCQLARDLGVTQRTAWFLNHRIRKMLAEKDNTNQVVMSGEIQCDETFIGGKRKNMHGRKRQLLKEMYGAAGTADKFPVFGMIQKGGKVRMMPVKSNEGDVLMPIIRENVRPGSLIVTDTHQGYFNLCEDYVHMEVVHSIGNYVDKETGLHTNSIESVWAILKRGYVGTYHYMSRKHLHRYCAEFAYRFNTRKITDCERFEHALKNTTGRLKYRDLVAA